MTNVVTKTGKRTVKDVNGNTIDIFCSGGKDSIEFHNSNIGDIIMINPVSIDKSKVVFNNIVYYIN